MRYSFQYDETMRGTSLRVWLGNQLVLSIFNVVANSIKTLDDGTIVFLTEGSPDYHVLNRI